MRQQDAIDVVHRVCYCRRCCCRRRILCSAAPLLRGPGSARARARAPAESPVSGGERLDRAFDQRNDQVVGLRFVFGFDSWGGRTMTAADLVAADEVSPDRLVPRHLGGHQSKGRQVRGRIQDSEARMRVRFQE